MSNGPSKKKCPSTVEITILPAVARVFKIASAYFKVAATNMPPPAPRIETSKVRYDQFDQAIRYVPSLLLPLPSNNMNRVYMIIE